MVPAVLAAPWLASLLVAAVGLNPALEGVGLTAPLPTAATFGVAAIAGLLALLALMLPTLSTGLSIAGVRAAVGRQVGRTLPQRLGLDLALVLLAAVALFQLRLYGAPITRNARGALGVDPLLVAAPAIGLLAGAVIAVRIVPRIAEIAERVLSRRPRPRALDGRTPGRPSSAALHAGRAAAGARRRARDVRLRARRDVGAEPGRPGGIRLGGGSCGSSPGRSRRCPTGRWARRCAASRASRPPRPSWRRASASVPRCVTAWSWGSTARPWPRSSAQPDSASAEATRASLRSLAEGRPATPGLAVADGTSRLSVVVDSTFTAQEGFETDPARLRGPRRDRRGRRRGREDRARRGHAGGTRRRRGAIGHRPRPARARRERLAAPVHVLAIELELSLTGLPDTLASGVITVRALGTSPDAAGDSWTDTPLADISPQSWTHRRRRRAPCPTSRRSRASSSSATAGPFSSAGVAALLRPRHRSRDRRAREPGLPRAHGSARGRHARGNASSACRSRSDCAARSTASRPSPRRSRCCWPTGRRWTSPATPAA